MAEHRRIMALSTRPRRLLSTKAAAEADILDRRVLTPTGLRLCNAAAMGVVGPRPTWGAEDFGGEPCPLSSATNSHVQIGVLSHRRSAVTTMTRLNMTRLSRLLYLCVGLAWAGVGLGWVGTGLAVWDGSETASAAVFSAVGGVMVATIFTAAAGWFAWKRRN